MRRDIGEARQVGMCTRNLGTAVAQRLLAGLLRARLRLAHWPLDRAAGAASAPRIGAQQAGEEAFAQQAVPRLRVHMPT